MREDHLRGDGEHAFRSKAYQVLNATSQVDVLAMAFRTRGRSPVGPTMAIS